VPLLLPARPGLRGHVQRLQKVVLQRARQHVGLAHREPPGEGQAQGGDPAQGWAARRDGARVLLVWRAKCLRARLHPRQGRLGGGAALQAALRRPELPQGHELVSLQWLSMANFYLILCKYCILC
jgi:hypothetical protein